VKPSKELSIGLLQILLAKPPKLEELLDCAVKGLELSTEYLTRLPRPELYLLNLLESRTYEDVDRILYESFSIELRILDRFLPDKFLHFLRTFLELYYIDYVALGTTKIPSESSLVRLILINLSSVISEYSKCTPKDIECFLMTFSERIRSSHDELEERGSRALDVAKALIAVRYFNYLRSSELLGLKLSKIEKVLAKLGMNPIVEASLRKLLERLEKLSKTELTRYTIYEAGVTYPLVKELLVYSGGLANTLTLYLVNRYYKLKVLRYSLLPRSLRRW
jgi:hypothetical protein